MVAGGGSVAEFQALTRADEIEGVLTRVVSSAECLDPDGPFGPRPGLAGSFKNDMLIERLLAALRYGFAQEKSRPTRGISFRAVVDLEKFGVKLRAQSSGRLSGQPTHDVDRE